VTPDDGARCMALPHGRCEAAEWALPARCGAR
jgi:hypothetical protein